MLPRAHVPTQSEQIANRQQNAVQATVRRLTTAVNQRLRCVAIEEYADSGTWNTALSTVTSAAYVDSAEQLTLATALLVGDVLEIHGRANVSIDASNVGDYQLTIYEGSNQISTAKPQTFYEDGSGFVSVPFSCRHAVTVAGVGRIVVQALRKSGTGNIYVMTRGSIVCSVWRP